MVESIYKTYQFQNRGSCTSIFRHSRFASCKRRGKHLKHISNVLLHFFWHPKVSTNIFIALYFLHNLNRCGVCEHGPDDNADACAVLLSQIPGIISYPFFLIWYIIVWLFAQCFPKFFLVGPGLSFYHLHRSQLI